MWIWVFDGLLLLGRDSGIASVDETGASVPANDGGRCDLSDTAVPTSSSRLTEESIDRALTIAIWVLVAGVLSLSAWFGLTIYSVRMQERLSTPSGRAIVDLEQQVRAEPNHLELRVRLGEAYATAGLYNEALHSFEQALKLDENHTGAYLDIGLVLMAQQDYPQAEGYFQKVISLTDGMEFEELSARREQAFFYMGQIAVEDQRFEEAIGLLKAALRIRRDASDTYYQLARAYHGIEEIDAAIENLSIALLFDPSYSDAHFELAKLYLENEQIAFAAVEFRKTAELVPDSDLPVEALAAMGPVSVRMDNARLAAKEGRTAEALDEVTIAVSIDPYLVEALVLRGSLLEESGDRDEEAFQSYERAVGLDPSNDEALAGVERLSPKK